MEQQEINMKEVIILFEDRNGDAWCKHLSGAEARLALTFIAALQIHFSVSINSHFLKNGMTC